MATTSKPSIEWTSFGGDPSDDVTLFLQSVKRVAFAQGRHKDDQWIIDYVETCLTGSAMGWFLQLDEQTARSWKHTQVAFLAQYASNRPKNTQAPAPAAAGPPPGARAPVTSASSPEEIDEDAPVPNAVRAFSVAGEPPVQVGKMMFLGDRGVGKSSLFARTTGSGWPAPSCYSSNSAAPGFTYEVHVRRVMPSDKLLCVHHWDPRGNLVPGSPIFRQYLDGIMGVYLIYDITSWTSFQSIRRWLAEVRKCTPPLMWIKMVGNKLDLERQRQVTTTQGVQLARELGIAWAGEVSAKTNDGVDGRFRGSTSIRRQFAELLT